MKTLEKMPLGEYETVIERFIEEAARWDGALPVETFFDAWAALESRKDQVAKQSPYHNEEIASSQRTLLAMTQCTEFISAQYRSPGRGQG
ncbi:MAG: hypothetical protein CVU38_17170 [Chloroflexi bacterium HGW-Chloroflexi-1]|nr:MAG: hypothetical protein CVU38_17170 [Chloroflexi bacterium HGW-Chloroflexi-1]